MTPLWARRLVVAGSVAAFLLLAMVSVGLPIYFHATAWHPSPAQWATYQRVLYQWENSPAAVACAHAKDQNECFTAVPKPSHP